ncbi:hypothetical protein [Micromonospora coerulea]
MTRTPTNAVTERPDQPHLGNPKWIIPGRRDAGTPGRRDAGTPGGV